MRLSSNPPVCDSYVSLVAWMRLTALNVARNTLVAESRRVRREQSQQKSAQSHQRETEDLTAILTQLDAEELELLRLRHIEGLQIRAIALVRGVTPRAIESALRRIVARLREGGTR